MEVKLNFGGSDELDRGEKIPSPNNKKYLGNLLSIERRITEIQVKQIEAHRKAENVYFR